MALLTKAIGGIVVPPVGVGVGVDPAGGVGVDVGVGVRVGVGPDGGVVVGVGVGDGPEPAAIFDAGMQIGSPELWLSMTVASARILPPAVTGLTTA